MASLLSLFDETLFRAERLFKLGRVQDAGSVYESLSRFSDLPVDVVVKIRCGLGKISHLSGSYRKAVRHFTVALAHSPNNQEILYLRAKTFAVLGKKAFKRCQMDLQEILRANASSAKANSLMGLVLSKNGNHESALEYHYKAVDLNKKQPVYLKRLVKVLMELDMWDEACSVICKSMFPNSQNKKFQVIWDHFQFQRTRFEQESKSCTITSGMVVLPFLKLNEVKSHSGNTRMDGPESIPTPHARKAKFKKSSRWV